MEQGKRWGADPVLIGTGMALAHGKCQGATLHMATRTRRFKCCRDTLRDWATSKTDGFKMLPERGTPGRGHCSPPRQSIWLSGCIGGARPFGEGWGRHQLVALL